MRTLLDRHDRCAGLSQRHVRMMAAAKTCYYHELYASSHATLAGHGRYTQRCKSVRSDADPARLSRGHPLSLLHEAPQQSRERNHRLESLGNVPRKRQVLHVTAILAVVQYLTCREAWRHGRTDEKNRTFPCENEKRLAKCAITRLTHMPVIHSGPSTSASAVLVKRMHARKPVRVP